MLMTLDVGEAISCLAARSQPMVSVVKLASSRTGRSSHV
jgi:hypothetical protein